MEIYVSVFFVTLLFGCAVEAVPVLTLSVKTGGSLTPTEGDTVTLVCSETAATTALVDSQTLVTFFKERTPIAAVENEITIATTPAHEITFHAVKPSDSGLYKFQIDVGDQQKVRWTREESPAIRLQVTAKPTEASTPTAGAAGPVGGVPQAVIIAAIIISVLIG